MIIQQLARTGGPVARRTADQHPRRPHDRPDRGTNVRWFSDLGMADLDQVGGKNASLGEMVSHLTDLGSRAQRLRDDGRRLRALHRRRRPRRAHRRAARRTSTPTTSAALAEVGREIRGRGRRAGVPRRPRGRRPRGLRRAGRGVRRARSRRSPYAPRPPPRTCPTPPSPASRRPSSTSRGIDAVLHVDPRGLRLALQRPGHRLPRAPRLRPRRRRPLRRRAADGALRRRRLRRACSRWTPSRASRDAVFVTSAYGLGEGVVQGAVNPDEFYVYKPALRAGRPAVLKRGVGGKATKMVYTDDATVGRTTEFVDVDAAGPPAAQPHRRRGRGAGPARAGHRGPLRPADGHRVGQGRRRRAGSTSCRRAPRPCSRARPARSSASGSTRAVDRGRRGAGRGPRDRPEDRRGRGAGARARSTRCTSSSRARCSSPT